MAYCAALDVNGAVSLTGHTIDQCPGFILLEPQEYLMNYAATGITVEDIASVYGFGFSSVLAFWLLGYAVRKKGQ